MPAVKFNMMQLLKKRNTEINAAYTFEGIVLENVEGIKHLGETMTHDLRGNKHVSYLCTQADRTVGASELEYVWSVVLLSKMN